MMGAPPRIHYPYVPNMAFAYERAKQRNICLYCGGEMFERGKCIGCGAPKRRQG